MRASKRGEAENGEQRWLDEAEGLGLACAVEIHGDDEGVYPEVVMAVRMAAASLWRTRKGKARPRWSKLRVNLLVADMRRLGFRDEQVESVLRHVFAFFSYLRVHGRISERRSLAAQQRIWPYVSQAVQRVLEEEFGIPAAAVTSVYAMNDLALAMQAGIAVGTA